MITSPFLIATALFLGLPTWGKVGVPITKTVSGLSLDIFFNCSILPSISSLFPANSLKGRSVKVIHSGLTTILSSEVV